MNRFIKLNAPSLPYSALRQVIRTITALPPDVRRGYAPPVNLEIDIGLRPWFEVAGETEPGAQPELKGP